MTIKRKGLEEKLKKDPRVKSFRAEVKHAKTLEKIEKFHEEVMGFQIKRVKSTETHDKVLANVQHHLSKVRLANQAYRSRIIANKAECVALCMGLDKKYRLLRKFIISAYAVDLASKGLKTKTDRDAWIDAYFFNQLDFINRLDTAIEIFDIVIEDIDSQSFAVKDVIQTLTVEFKYKQPEH